MHDRNGHHLKVGDVVIIQARITAVQGHTDYCNCTVHTMLPMHPGSDPTTITFNTRQTEKLSDDNIVWGT